MIEKRKNVVQKKIFSGKEGGVMLHVMCNNF